MAMLANNTQGKLRKWVEHMSPRKTVCSLIIILFVIAGCKTNYPRTTYTFSVHKDANTLARGKNLTYIICAQCHYDAKTAKFTGKQMKDLPKFMGKVYSANLTDDSKNGVLKNYTDAELAYLLKTGVSHTGKFIPYMVRPNIADEDLNDIIAYLRSGDDAVHAEGAYAANKTKLSLIGKMAIGFSGKPLPYKQGTKSPDENDGVTYGRYLVDNIGCFHCHSRRITGLDYMESEKSKGYMQGGMKWKIEGHKVYSANLTFSTNGIRDFSKEDFRNAVRNGEVHGKKLMYPMPHYLSITDKQADAIYAYLKTLPPSDHKVKGH